MERVRIVYIVGHDESVRRRLVERIHGIDLGAEHVISSQQLLETIMETEGGHAVLNSAMSQELGKILQARLDEMKISGAIIAISACEETPAKKDGK